MNCVLTFQNTQSETEHQKHAHSLRTYLSALGIWKAFMVTAVCLHRACFSIFACARASRFKPQTPCSRSINKPLISCLRWVWWSCAGQQTALATCVLCRSRLASKANIWKRNRILVKPGAQLMLFALKHFLKKISWEDSCAEELLLLYSFPLFPSFLPLWLAECSRQSITQNQKIMKLLLNLPSGLAFMAF